jgi:hypothetical protein
MNYSDFVYDNVYKGCKAIGCIEMVAKDAATMTLQKYKNNQFTNVSALIKTAISDAKKLNKAKKK